MTTERWALVPVEVLDLYQFMAMAFAPMTSQQEEIAKSLTKARAAMNSPNQGAALLAEVLAARDALNSDIRDGEMVSEYSDRKSAEHDALLAALDKLGPAAEGAT